MHYRTWLTLCIVSFLPGTACSQPPTDGYYKSLALDAIAASVVYYSGYADCLEKNKLASEVCEDDGQARKPSQLNNVIVIRDAFLNKYRKIYPSKPIPVSVSNIELRTVREKFSREVVYFQRRLTIFMAKVELDCGTPQNAEQFKALGLDLMQYFITDPSMSTYALSDVKLNDPLFEQYEMSIANKIYKGKLECGYYLKRNRTLLVNVYSDPYTSMDKNWRAEQILGHFMSVFMGELLAPA